MKQVFRLLCAASALVFVFGLFTFVGAQTSTPASTVTQVTSSARDSFATDISGDGRLVVIESTGDIATGTKQNADGNREIFLYDNAQGTIVQITNTRSALNDATKSATDATNIKVEVDNVKPVISGDGRFVVFGSNAPTPANFDATTLTDAALNSLITTDGFNTELFLYEVSTGTLTRLTTTRASRTPQSGSSTRAPFVADDNRSAAISDDGSLIAFVSISSDAGNTPSGASNTDGNAEIFIYSRRSGAFTQLTNTQGLGVFSDNPSLSSDGSVVAFISNANITGDNNDGSGNGNAEIFVANVNSATGAIANAPRQITRTKASTNSLIVNILSPGRRLSRDGNLLAFESTANDPSANNGDNQVSAATFVYNIAARTFAQYGPRAALANDVISFPIFTDYRAADGTACTSANSAVCTTPTTLVFSSRLSFTASGDAPPSSTDSSSLNPNSATQLFSVPLSQPNATPNPSNRFTRLINNPTTNTAIFLQSLTGDSSQRIAFSAAATELGGGNTDGSAEVFYLIARNGTDVTSSATVNFFTALTTQQVTAGAAAPAVSGLAPGELGIITIQPTMAMPLTRDQTTAPSFEKNGISVAVNNVAATIYFVNANQINFVVPVGLSTTASNSPASVVIFNSNNNTVIRATLAIVAAQPDIGVIAGTNNRATIFNVTGGMMMTGEPFSVTTNVTTSQGTTTNMPTVLGIMLTGVRNVQASQVTVTIGSTSITGAAIQAVSPVTPLGFDQINVQIPASLAGLKDQPVVVSISIGGVTYTSRTNTPPLISFQ